MTCQSGTRITHVGQESLCVVKQLMCFVHMGHNLVISNSKFTTSCRDLLAKTSRIMINLFLSPKMRSPLTLRHIGVIFSVHGDSTVCDIHSPRGHHLSGLNKILSKSSCHLRFPDPKMAMEVLFSIFMILNKLHIFTPSFSGGRGGVRVRVRMFFFYTPHPENMVCRHFVCFWS